MIESNEHIFHFGESVFFEGLDIMSKLYINVSDGDEFLLFNHDRGDINVFNDDRTSGFLSYTNIFINYLKWKLIKGIN